jgi:hypothetical protein
MRGFVLLILAASLPPLHANRSRGAIAGSEFNQRFLPTKEAEHLEAKITLIVKTYIVNDGS